MISVSVRNVHGYISLSKENYLVFSKCFWYSWFVIVIFPTFGLTTFHAVFERFLEADRNRLSSSVKWQCFFQPETSAFFVELVISTGLVTTALELLRPADLVGYVLSLSCAKTEAAVRPGGDRKNKRFGFGENYGEVYWGNISQCFNIFIRIYPHDVFTDHDVRLQQSHHRSLR